MRLLSLDLSTSTGWALFENKKLVGYGRFEQIKVVGFNVNAHPNEFPGYPQNIVTAAFALAEVCAKKIDECMPDQIVIENTVKGRNRHTQRILEWCHFTVLGKIYERNVPFAYMDPSEWRGILEIRLSADDKKNNKDVKAGKKRGKVNRKHLAIRYCEKKHGLKLLVKDDDIADAICLGEAYLKEIPGFSNEK